MAATKWMFTLGYYLLAASLVSESICMVVLRRGKRLSSWDCVTLPMGVSTSCYYLGESAGGWWQAIRECSEQYIGHLAIFNKDSEWTGVVEKLRKHGVSGEFYLGAVKVSGSPWFWYETGIPLVADEEYADQQLDDISACLALDIETGAMNGVECDRPLKYLCERPEAGITYDEGYLLIEEK